MVTLPPPPRGSATCNHDEDNLDDYDTSHGEPHPVIPRGYTATQNDAGRPHVSMKLESVAEVFSRRQITNVQLVRAILSV